VLCCDVLCYLVCVVLWCVHLSDHQQQDVRRLSLISQVRELFPDIGEGFAAACLHHFGDDAEKTIDILLNDNLPKELKGMARNMPLPSNAIQQQDTTSQPQQKNTEPITRDEVFAPKKDYNLSERRNIFDGDNFDILSGIDLQFGEDTAFVGKKWVLETK